MRRLVVVRNLQSAHSPFTKYGRLKMSHRFLTSFGVAVLICAVVWCATPPVGAQSQTTRDVEAIKAAERKLIQDVADGLKKRDAVLHPQIEVPRNWKPSRTPWGDPALTRVYSNSDEAAIPFEKPSQFEGRRLEDITDAELEQLRQARRNQTVE